MSLPDNSDVNYTYDDRGNTTSKTQGNTEIDYSYDNNNNLVKWVKKVDGSPVISDN